MRLNALCLIGTLAISAIPLSAGAAPAQSDRQAAVSAPRATPAAYACPPRLLLGTWQLCPAQQI
jgi:hypothetical protein